MTRHPLRWGEPPTTAVRPPVIMTPRPAAPPSLPHFGNLPEPPTTSPSAASGFLRGCMVPPPPPDGEESDGGALRVLIAVALAVVVACVGLAAFNRWHERQGEIRHRHAMEEIRISAAASELIRVQGDQTKLQWWLEQDDAWRRGHSPQPAPPHYTVGAICCVSRAQVMEHMRVNDLIITRLQREARPVP